MSVWSTRRARALTLATERAHAADILRCYADVTVAQERIAEQVPASDWLAVVRAGDRDGPVLKLDRLPIEEALPLFGRFLGDLRDVGTEVMMAEARRLASDRNDTRRRLLESVLRAPDGEDRPFPARAFVEAVAVALAGRVLPASGASEVAGPNRCGVCGAPPVVATLRDLPTALGSGGIVCSRCGSEQRVRRLTCAHCGESNAERLRIHTPESLPHVRIDECGSCRTYLKTVDLRRRGDAVPIVEDLATPELDLWAHEQGLSKGRTNLFGM